MRINMSSESSENSFEYGHSVFNSHEENEAFARGVGATLGIKWSVDKDDFKICTARTEKVHSLDEILRFIQDPPFKMNKQLIELNVGDYAHRRFVCYRDIKDISTECFVTVWVRRMKE